MLENVLYLTPISHCISFLQKTNHRPILLLPISHLSSSIHYIFATTKCYSMLLSPNATLHTQAFNFQFMPTLVTTLTVTRLPFCQKLVVTRWPFLSSCSIAFSPGNSTPAFALTPNQTPGNLNSSGCNDKGKSGSSETRSGSFS